MSFIIQRQTGIENLPSRPLTYPFPSLKIGDSIKVKGKASFQRARMAAYQYGRRNDCTFHTGLTKTGGVITRVK